MIVVVLCSYLYNRWLLDPRTYFHADDWNWLGRGEFWPWSEYAAVLPEAAYNDRPVGAAFIKLLYQLFSLDHRAFQLVLIAIHALNCAVLYLFSMRYVGRTASLFAAALAAMWFSTLDAIGWSAAIFDVLGATLCLLTLLCRQYALRAGNDLRFDLAGAVCYLLAIRTKEFALGTIVLLFAMGLSLDRRSFRETAKALWPYVAVFIVYAVVYAQLLVTAPPSSGPYQLQFNFENLLTNLQFHFLTAFDRQFVGRLTVLSLFVCMLVAIASANGTARRVAGFGLLGFLVTLGPTLLLPHGPESDYHALYLYAPHFFLALSFGATLGGGLLSGVLTLVVVTVILVAPTWSGLRRDIQAYYFELGQSNSRMMESALAVLGSVSPSSTIVIAGVKPYFNPFSAGPGDSLRVALKDRSIAVVMDRPEAELATKFCDAAAPRRFILFSGTQAKDVSAERTQQCAGGPRSVRHLTDDVEAISIRRGRDDGPWG